MKNKTGMDFKTRTANMWRKRFLKSLHNEVRLLLPSDTAEIMTSVSEQAQVLFDKHLHRAADKQGMMAVGFPALMLASHRELTRRGVSEGLVFEVLRRSFRSTLQSEMQGLMRIQMFLLRDPFTFYQKKLIPLLYWYFGRSFTWDEKTTATGWALIGKQCGFWDMFRAEGEPQLTKLVCEWDRNWLNVLDSSKRPIATRRTMTMSTGAPHCEFHFDRAVAGPSKTVDIVIESSR